MPGYDDEHRKVFVLRPDNYDDTKLKKIDIEKANLIVGLMSGEIHEEFCCHQVVMLYDWDSFSFSRLTTENMRLGQKMLQYYQVFQFSPHLNGWCAMVDIDFNILSIVNTIGRLSNAAESSCPCEYLTLT